MAWISGPFGAELVEEDPIATTALENHKTSADHDARYFTEAETNSLLANKADSTDSRLHDRQHAATSTLDHSFPGDGTLFLAGDGSFKAPPSGSGSGIAFREFTYLADAVGTTMTNIGAAEKLVGFMSQHKHLDLTGFTQARIVCAVNKVGTGTQTWKFQYSLDNAIFLDLVVVDDALASGEHLLEGAWTAIPTAALVPVYIRLVGKSTTNNDDPVLRGAHLQVK